MRTLCSFVEAVSRRDEREREATNRPPTKTELRELVREPKKNGPTKATFFQKEEKKALCI